MVNDQAKQYAGNASQEFTKLNNQQDQLLNNLGPLSEQAQQLVGSKGINLKDVNGFDPATMSAITGNTMGAAMSPFSGAEQGIQRNAALTHNSASTPGAMTDLAFKKGTAGAQAGRDIQLADTGFKLQNADIANQQRMAGLDLMHSLYSQGLDSTQGAYGTQVGAQVGLQGQVPGLLSGRAAGGGWSQGFNDVLTGIGSLVPKAK